MSYIKRFIERNFISCYSTDNTIEECEKNIPGYWYIIAEYFTHI